MFYKNQKGFALIYALLISGIVIMLVLISIPVVKYYRGRMYAYGCASELATAQDMLTIDYISENSDPTPADAQAVVTYAMDGWESLCPAGGDTYVIDNPDSDEPPYIVVCGLHDSDTNRRTRLNAGNALKQIRNALQQASRKNEIKALLETSDSVDKNEASGQEASSSKKSGNSAEKTSGEEITVTLNGKNYTAVEVESEQPFKRGTTTTKDYEKSGTVIFYSISGLSDFSKDSGLSDGQVWYLCYADENHCAIWHSNTGWTGDSYNEINNGSQN